ncbi:bifunctional diguanylate cyclase/phosphodiesterase [Psychrobium sp. 1_MG-2023]|uniref:putative bifunctional diguanylate cyclase/phosphodiesterase n=1 Tax=Psychrobium sp. 1_MG-2023 TaxID=3062624 RepID=UPI000C32DB3C|nr:EAL domain-containing protein [Psychrobium sp. 1_MG-2023]MDP2561701.1 EAL domain-containing protein [Psychrobium sp. 1_MG-2023]PKF57102.1 hypothetical protein CW748_08425 [Alteromonadales bacterium alter-6D02]
MKPRLQLRVARAIILLILVIIATMGGFLTWKFDAATQRLHQISESTLTNALIEQLNQKGVDTTTYISETLKNALYTYDMEQIQQQIFAITSQKDVVKTSVFDAHGKIIHDGTELINTFGQSIPTPISQGLENSPRNVFIVMHENSIDFAKHIYIGNENIGGIILTYSLEHIRTDIEQLDTLIFQLVANQLQDNLFNIATIAVFLVFLSSFLAWRLTSRFVEPIVKLSEYAAHIGSGDYDFEMKVSASRDEISELGRSFNTMRDNLKQSSSKINHLANHDTLTKLPNRRLFVKNLDLAIKNYQRNKIKFSLLFIDIDNFKNVNDSMGHDVGDEVLIQVTSRLKHSIRSADSLLVMGAEQTQSFENSTVSRLGGDEFTIILMGVSEPAIIAHIAQRIITNMAEPCKVRNKLAYIGASIGISIFPDDDETSSGLMKNADIAMYHAKEHGKNQYQFFSTEINNAAMKLLTIENDLRTALEEEQFCLHYQPKLDVKTRKIVCVEALLRWKHPVKGDISPSEFIPIAEQSGQILAIGDWVLDRACQQLSSWQSTEAKGLPVAINISAVQLAQDRLDEAIIKALDKYDLPYHLLQIEMTETAVIESKQDACGILTRLSEMGIKVWMDDFGQGYSSLGYLSTLPFYGLKIDYSFIRSIHTEEKNRKLCQAIISMAHNLNLLVVAEGIEEQEQHNIIEGMDCDFAQGFFYEKPIPAEKLFNQFFVDSGYRY